MRVVIQRVQRASVRVGGDLVGEIGPGLMMLVGMAHGDDAETVTRVTSKIANLRIFEDADGAMNRSGLDLLEAGDPVGMLVVSQFTLYADIRKGRRPSFTDAAHPNVAEPLVDLMVRELGAVGFPTATGRFGAEMAVELVNDGPVTILVDSDVLWGGRG